MINKVGNYIWQISTSVGTGNIVLADHPTFVHFSDEFGIGINNKFFYGMHHRTLLEWEVGSGYMLDATTLVRENVLRSSNADALVNFSVGSKDILSDVPAQYQNYTSNFVYGETPVGDVDGVNALFTLSSNYVIGTIQLYINGLRAKAGDDYDETVPNQITLSSPPEIGYTLMVDFIKS